MSGPVLLMLGIGNVWRSPAGLVIGLVFILAGVALTVRAFNVRRRELRSSGQPSPRLGLQIVLLILALAVGSTVYSVLLSLADRS